MNHGDGIGWTSKPFYSQSAPLGTLTVNPDVPDGTKLGSVTIVAIKPTQAWTECNPAGKEFWALGPRGERVGTVVGGYTVVPSSMPGIGLSTRPNGFDKVVPWYSGDMGRAVLDWGVEYRLVVDLIKTGPIKGSGALQGIIFQQVMVDRNFTIAVYEFPPGGMVVTPQIPTCAVDDGSKQRTYNVPDIKTTDLKGINTVGAYSTFNIQLSCSGGDPGVNARIGTVFTDATNPGNTSNTLSLSGSSTAKGVGIQIIPVGTDVPVVFGPDSNIWGASGQREYGSTGPGRYSIPFAVRYIQTSNTVKPGTANGLATFTMSYR
ncbi:hypothetical protein JCM19000A_15320 [Silvimonas sp. JCM 19000]